eukprot:537545_1
MSQQLRMWKKLNGSGVRFFLGPFSLNKDEFFIMNLNGTSDDDCGDDNNEFFKYNVKHNKWTTMFVLRTSYKLCAHDLSATFDRTNQLLYLSGNSLLYQINLKTKAIELLLDNGAFDDFPAMSIINDKLHILHDRTHVTYDVCSKSVTTNYEIGIKIGVVFYVQCILHMKSRNNILMFGNDSVGTIKVIYEFSLENDEWHQWNVKLPTHLSISVAAIFASTDEKYIFFLGADCSGAEDTHRIADGYTYSDKISVFDVEKAVLRDCSIKCPYKGLFGGLIVNNEEDDDLLVFGYVKELYGSGCFNDVQQMPHYLIQLIRNYVCNEFIHLIQYYIG